jgi:AraC family L-rhamnose operon transcriptional activator RhaR
LIVLMAKNLPAPVEPIVLRRLRLRCGDWAVRALRVNRHLHPFDHPAPHRHAHGQLLLYLRGSGEQRIGSVRRRVAPGAVFFIPPGRIHDFREEAPRRAICLVADLSGPAVRRQGCLHGWLSADSLATVRQHVAALAAEAQKPFDLGAGGAALLIIEACRRCCLGERPPAPEQGGVVSRLQRVWRPGADGTWPRPAELARSAGLQQDYLNRLVRRSAGLTLGQWRDRELLRLAEAELRRGAGVNAVAAKLGFADQSYFARWFRKQTGLAPTQWRGQPRRSNR